MGSNAKELVRLALPLGLIQVGYHLTGLIDTAFAGRIDDLSLAATGLGASLFFAIGVMGIGIALGLDPLVSQAIGAGHMQRAERCLQQGVYGALLAALPLIIIILLIGWNLEHLGIGDVLAQRTRAYVFIRAPSLMPLMCSVSCRVFLQAHKNIKPILLGTLLTNIVNIIANSLLVFGDASLEGLGLPAMGLPSLGVTGLAFASVAAAISQMLVLGVAAYLAMDSNKTLDPPSPQAIARIVHVGFPIGLYMIFEVGAFSAVQFLMGNIGIAASAAHQTALTLAALTFSFCLGIGSATSVLVGHAVGACNTKDTRTNGFLGIALGAAFMCCPALLMWVIPQELARLITPNPVVIHDAAILLRIAGFFQIVDGIQTVAAGALRGAGVTRWTSGAQFIGHWVVGLPLGVGLAFGLDMGPTGLWWGFVAGLTVVALALTTKFFHITQIAVQPIDHSI